MKAIYGATVSILIAVAVLAMSLFAINFANAQSSSNSLTANVNVGNVIYLTVKNATSGNIISFGSIFPGSSYDTNVLVTDTDNGGNIGANVLVAGSNWLNASTSNSFGVSNTLWSASSLSTPGGTGLTGAFANTGVFISAPSLSTPSESNTVYFGITVPDGTAPGNYIQTISFENENVSQGIYNKSSTANAITAKVNVQGTCYISLSPNTISFGSIPASANVPTNVLVTDSDTGGNVASKLLVEGNNWAQTTNDLVTFGVSNTLWNPTSLTVYSGNALSNTLFDTGIIIPAPSAAQTTTSNSIYFGLGIPGGTPAGTYEQTITIENSC
ncbi:MAG: hypothetical protein M1125_00480 [Candidatus Marsarchaeota archaeon]|nr:hypothetical protein [Candidatus Marsarchaeota archaeon]